MYRTNLYKKFLLHSCCAPLLQLYRMYVCVCVLSCVGKFSLSCISRQTHGNTIASTTHCIEPKRGG